MIANKPNQFPDFNQIPDYLVDDNLVLIQSSGWSMMTKTSQYNGFKLLAFRDGFGPDGMNQSAVPHSEQPLTKIIQGLWAISLLGPHCSFYVCQYRPCDSMAPALMIATESFNLDGPDSATALDRQFRSLAEQLGIELVLVGNTANPNAPGLLVMDMDSTAIEIECIDEIAKLTGVGDEVSAVTREAMNGGLDFAQSLHQRVSKLAGASETVLAQIIETLPLMPGLALLVAHLQARGWFIVIASGGFTYFTHYLQQRLGLTATFANQLEIIDGQLTGRVLGDIVDAKRKAQLVTQLAEQYQLPRSQTVAIGDGSNDLLMLASAGLGVAFHAKPIVRQQAAYNINQGSLAQLLYLLIPAHGGPL